MKGISGNPALDAYNRMAVKTVTSNRSVQQPETGTTEAPQNTSAAKVAISSQAKDMAASSAQAASDPQKVEAIRSQMAEGKLQFDSQVVAQRMLEALG